MIEWWCCHTCIVVCWTFFRVDMGLTWQLTTVSHGSHFTPQLTCSPVSVCLQGAVAGARSSKVEDTFVPLWRLFWGGIYKGHSQEKVGKRLQRFELAWFQYCVIHRELCSMTFKNPYNSLFFLLIFLLSVLPSPAPQQKPRHLNRLIDLLLSADLGSDSLALASWAAVLVKMRHPRCPCILDILVASCLGCTIPNSDLLIHSTFFKYCFPQKFGISQESYEIINTYPLTWRLGYGSTTLYQQLRHTLLTFLRTNRCVLLRPYRNASPMPSRLGEMWHRNVHDVTMKSGCFSLQVFLCI